MLTGRVCRACGHTRLYDGDHPSPVLTTDKEPEQIDREEAIRMELRWIEQEERNLFHRKEDLMAELKQMAQERRIADEATKQQ